MSHPNFTSLEDLPPGLWHRVQSELQPGEHLVWVGQPLWRPVRDFGCLLVFVVSMLLFGGLISYFMGLDEPFVRNWSYAWWIMGGLTIAYLVIEPWVVRKNTWYAVTDRRVILSTLIPFRITREGQLRAMERMFQSYQDLKNLYRIEANDGSGDLIFEECKYKDEDGKMQIDRRGFRKIAEVRRVEELVRATLLKDG